MAPIFFASFKIFKFLETKSSSSTSSKSKLTKTPSLVGAFSLTLSSDSFKKTPLKPLRLTINPMFRLSISFTTFFKSFTGISK